MMVYWLKVACGAFSGSGMRGQKALAWFRSRIEIRDELTFHPRDLILQHEFALLESLQLQLIGMDIERQACDHLIQVPMLNTERPQLFYVAEQLAVDVVFDFRHGG